MNLKTLNDPKPRLSWRERLRNTPPGVRQMACLTGRVGVSWYWSVPPNPTCWPSLHNEHMLTWTQTPAHQWKECSGERWCHQYGMERRSTESSTSLKCRAFGSYNRVRGSCVASASHLHRVHVRGHPQSNGCAPNPCHPGNQVKALFLDRWLPSWSFLYNLSTINNL